MRLIANWLNFKRIIWILPHPYSLRGRFTNA